MKRRSSNTAKVGVVGLVVTMGLGSACAGEPRPEAVAYCEVQATCDANTDVDSCAANVESRWEQAEERGCGGELETLVSCASDEGACEIGAPTSEACVPELMDAMRCMPRNICDEAVVHQYDCGGFELPMIGFSCDELECGARCMMAAPCDVLQAMLSMDYEQGSEMEKRVAAVYDCIMPC